MAKTETVQKSPSKREDAKIDESPEVVETPAADATDELLDEIDEVLESNASEFVAGFVQKGGQ